jgi:hypothetical protein
MTQNLACPGFNHPGHAPLEKTKVFEQPAIIMILFTIIAYFFGILWWWQLQQRCLSNGHCANCHNKSKKSASSADST